MEINTDKKDIVIFIKAFMIYVTKMIKKPTYLWFYLVNFNYKIYLKYLRYKIVFKSTEKNYLNTFYVSY